MQVLRIVMQLTNSAPLSILVTWLNELIENFELFTVLIILSVEWFEACFQLPLEQK